MLKSSRIDRRGFIAKVGVRRASAGGVRWLVVMDGMGMGGWGGWWLWAGWGWVVGVVRVVGGHVQDGDGW